jgi:hypothetical protein
MLIILSFLFLPLQAFGFTDNEYVSLIEKDLFHTQYVKEPLSTRIGRIEKEIYGKKFNLPNTQRITKLKQVFHYNEPSKPVKLSNIKQKINSKKTINPKSANTFAYYPKITDLEKKVFKKSYEKENLYNRLDRLEIAVLKNKTNYPLSDRMDNLEAIINRNSSSNTTHIQPVADQSPEINVNKTNSTDKLSELEIQLLKTTYPNDPTDTRISRLEINVFNKTSPEDDLEQRIDRITAVTNASESSKQYQNAQTARQAASTVNVLGIGLIILKGLLF